MSDAARTAREWIGAGAFPWPSVHDVEEGQLLVGCYCVASAQLGTTRHDKPFLRLQLSDLHGTVEARVWDDVDAAEPAARAGAFVGVRARVEVFRDTRQLKIEAIAPLRLAEDELELFLPRSPRDSKEMEAELAARIRSIADPGLRAVVERLIGAGGEHARAFRLAPAAKHNHHAYVGGLLEHTLSLTGVADRLAQHYGADVDRDLLLAGALLHDIGKTREIALEPGFQYTTDGKLLGHILIGLDMVRAAAAKVPSLRPERLRLLLHLVASHQGRYEWQSPREPLVLEAILLHYADDMDAKMQQAMRLLDRVEEGWTPYDRSFGRELLRHLPPGAPSEEEKAAEAARRDRFTIDMFEEE